MTTPSAAKFPPVAELIEHEPPMRLVKELVREIPPGGLVSRVVIDEDFVFLKDGKVDSVVCVEFVAQTVACFVGLADTRSNLAPRGGLLVGCRDARFNVPTLHVGDDLLVSVERQWIREPAASFLGEVKRGEEVVATIELSVVSGVSIEALSRELRGSSDV